MHALTLTDNGTAKASAGANKKKKQAPQAAPKLGKVALRLCLTQPHQEWAAATLIQVKTCTILLLVHVLCLDCSSLDLARLSGVCTTQLGSQVGTHRLQSLVRAI